MLPVADPPGLAEAELLRRARAFRGPVWWIALPAQRRYFLWRLGQEGVRLGLEALHFQRAYFRVVSEAGEPRPVLGRGERIARVAEAYREALGQPPAPGEAVLFTRGVAELKRHGLSPDWRPDCRHDGEALRLLQVYRVYERAKAADGVWDSDDVRLEAVRLVEAGRFRFPGGVFVAGFFELLPLEARFLEGLSAGGAEVFLSTPAPGPGNSKRRRFRAENPALELRWALYSLAQDVAGGIPPHELALVVPPGRVAQAELLAREYDVYLMRETPRSLAETAAGKAALALATFHRHPRPEGLFWFPELRPLAEAALARGLSGREALAKLAAELGLSAAFEAALAELAPGPELAARVLSRIEAEEEHAALLERLWREAQAAGGAEADLWWESLIRAQEFYRPEPLGIALLTPEAAVGRRYRKAYVVSASEGSYRLSEREDYFFPEECRRQGLTPRLRGHDRWRTAALLNLGEEVWISYPETDAGAVLRPDPALFEGEAGEPLDHGVYPSRHLKRGRRYRRELGELALPKPRSVSEVRGFAHAPCGLRHYLSGRLPVGRVRSEALEALARGDEEALAHWRMPRERWRRLRFFETLEVAPGVWATAHALEDADVHEFSENKSLRWDTLLLYGKLGGRVYRWRPGVGEEEVTAQAKKELKDVEYRFKRALRELAEARAEPRAGWHCRDCPYQALCREGER